MASLKERLALLARAPGATGATGAAGKEKESKLSMPSFLRRRGSDLKSMISDPTPLTPPRNRNDRPDRPSLGNEHEQDDYHDHAQFDEEFVEGVIDDEEDEFGQPRSLRNPSFSEQARTPPPAPASSRRESFVSGFEGKHSSGPRPGDAVLTRVVSKASRIGKEMEGKTLVVTGGASGLGKAVAHLFASRGANVAIISSPWPDDHNKDESYYTEREIEERYGKDCLTVPADLADEHEVEAAIERIADHFGRIDVLVNQAAVSSPSVFNFEDIDIDSVRSTFRNNVYSAFFTTKHCLRHMRRGGSIINSISVGAYVGIRDKPDFAASKGAMMTFTRSLAKNLMDRGIRVNGVAPGPVYTESLMASLSADEISFEDFVREWSPMGRAAQPHEIAPCYLFLADEDASGTMMGQVLHPNCGMVLNA